MAALQTCRLGCSTTTPLADWRCGGCGFRNCDFRTDCFQCHQPNPRPETSQLIEDDAAASVQEIMATATGQKEQPSSMLDVGEAWQQTPAAGLSRGATPLSSSPLPSAPEFVAPGNARSIVHMPFKTGDWMCVCGQHNFARRVECMNCGRARRSLLPGAASVTAWTCLACYSTNPGDNRLCAICGAARSEPMGTGGTASVPGDDMQSEHATRPPDWVCAECKFANFASRGRCKRCGTPRVTLSGAGSTTLAASPNVNSNGASLQRSAEEMWRCECGYENYRTRQFCRKCGHRHRSGGAARRQV